MKEGLAVTRTFSQSMIFDLCKVYGYRETTIEFESEEQANEFVKKVEQGNIEAINKLNESNYETFVDDWSVNDSKSVDDWKVD